MNPLSAPGPRALPPSLTDALVQARAWGFLGHGPLDVHVAHAQGFADAADAVSSAVSDAPAGAQIGAGRWMDLGSGGGIPGLILAHRWPDREAVLLDSNERRARFLVQVVEDLGWGDRIRVVTDRAELAGRVDGLRGSFSLVVARSFGAPPVTAECAAPFLRTTGILIVSEPPTAIAQEAADDTRWPQDGLALVGLENVTLWRDVFGYRVLRQTKACPDRFPRRVGVPAKRPLYRVENG